MKLIKPICLFFVMFIFSLILPTAITYADSFYQDENTGILFEIKSGIDLEKDYITTFEKTRTITGVSEPGNNINISVLQKVSSSEELDQDTYIEVYNYELTVGPSGYFSQAIDLVVGENLIIISSQKYNSLYSISTIIKRKNSEIKSTLEKIIILPISRS